MRRAHPELSDARVTWAEGRLDEAAEPAQRALTQFLALAMPLDAEEARVQLARALARRTPEVAVDEARTALAVFRELGAARQVDVAAALMRELGSAAGGGRQPHGTLTAREQEVLDLIALGMSNSRIARELVISEKTAGHHVSHILTKLGVTNRTEAAAYAARTTSR